MSHNLLCLAIDLFYVPIDYCLTNSELEAFFIQKGINYPDKFWMSTTDNRPWITYRSAKNYIDPINIKNDRNILYIECFPVNNINHFVILTDKEIEDIKNNFIIDGKLNEIDFILAYGKDYQDSKFGYDELFYPNLKIMIQHMKDGILTFQGKKS